MHRSKLLLSRCDDIVRHPKDVRSFGAVLFGRLGDLVGRKYTFLMTMTFPQVVLAAGTAFKHVHKTLKTLYETTWSLELGKIPHRVHVSNNFSLQEVQVPGGEVGLLVRHR